MIENGQIKRLLKLIALNNDENAYKELFVLFYNNLKQFANSILKSKEEAEEVVSDLFIRIWQKREQLANIEYPRLYLYSSTKNLALSRLTKKKKDFNSSPEDWLITLHSIYFDPEKLMVSTEIFQEIKRAINSLPARCRLIFKLVKEDGLKYKEVADLLDISIKTVEAQMAIALRRLGKSIKIKTAEPLKNFSYKKVKST